MSKNITSTLVHIIESVYGSNQLNESKLFATEHLSNTKIKMVDKTKMINTIKTINSKQKLDQYLTNCLLKFEGLGLK